MKESNPFDNDVKLKHPIISQEVKDVQLPNIFCNNIKFEYLLELRIVKNLKLSTLFT